jgi:hypothetical protein
MAFQETSGGESDSGGRSADRLVGSLVHRLLDRVGLDADLERAALADMAGTLLRADELGDLDSVDEVTRLAADAFRAVCTRADVRVRLIRMPDGPVVVLEFKSGRPRPEHRLQLEMYRRAAAQIFPDAVIESLLVYTDEVISAG